jgi:hypothetical protein
MIRLILNKPCLVHVQEEVQNVLVAHLLVSAIHSLHKNECEDHVYFFAQYIVTAIIVETDWTTGV